MAPIRGFLDCIDVTSSLKGFNCFYKQNVFFGSPLLFVLVTIVSAVERDGKSKSMDSFQQSIIFSVTRVTPN